MITVIDRKRLKIARLMTNEYESIDRLYTVNAKDRKIIYRKDL